MMRKKWIAISLAAVMAMGSLAGCSTSKKAAEATTEDAAGAYEDNYKEVDLNAEEYVELGQYKGIEIKKRSEEVNEEEFAERMEEERYNYAEYKEVVDRDTIKEDDIVNAEITCLVGNEIVEDLSNEMDITVGSGEMEFFDDAEVEKTLVGAKIGDTVKISGTFSDMLYSEMASGKKGVMEIKVNGIYKEEIPELTDELIKANTEYKSLEEFKASIRQDMLDTAKSDLQEEYKYELFDKVVENSKMIKDFPADAVEAETYNVLLDTQMMADFYGMELGESDEEIDAFFKEMYGTSKEDYVLDTLKRRCVIDLVLKAENAEITEEEIDQGVKDRLEFDGYESEDDVELTETEEDVNRDDVKSELTQQKFFDILLANAVIK